MQINAFANNGWLDVKLTKNKSIMQRCYGDTRSINDDSSESLVYKITLPAGMLAG